MSKIFISYRRSDTQDMTNRIYDKLRAVFGAEAIFKDVDSIHGGVDFRTAIAQALNQCRVMIVVIGATWLNATDRTGRPRLQDPGDFVRLEVEGALSRRQIHVFPLLVKGATMPGESQLPPSLAQLAYQNARQVDSDLDFHHDMERVIRELAQLIPLQTPMQPPAPRRDWPPVAAPPALPGNMVGRVFSSGIIGVIGGGAAVVIYAFVIYALAVSNTTSVIVLLPVMALLVVCIGWITGKIVVQRGMAVVSALAFVVVFLPLIDVLNTHSLETEVLFGGAAGITIPTLVLALIGCWLATRKHPYYRRNSKQDV